MSKHVKRYDWQPRTEKAQAAKQRRMAANAFDIDASNGTRTAYSCQPHLRRRRLGATLILLVAVGVGMALGPSSGVTVLLVMSGCVAVLQLRQHHELTLAAERAVLSNAK